MKLRLVLFTVAVMAVVWAQTIFNIYDHRRSAIREAEREVSTLARTLEVEALSSISATDLLIRLVMREVCERGWLTGATRPESEVQAYLRDIKAQLPQISNLVLIAADGRFVAQSVGPVPSGIDATEREYFKALLENPEMEQYISHGFYGRMSEKLVFAVTRRIRDDNGKFIGMIVASVDPSYYRDIYASLDIGHEGVIALFDSNGVLIERYPNPEGIVGTSVADRPLFAEYLARARAGSYINALQRDGVIRIIGYRAVADSPLVITVAKSLSDSLVQWRHEAGREVLTVGGITLLLAFGCALILRETASRQRSQKSLEESEHRFRSTFDHAPVGIAQLDLEGRWLLTNSALCEMLGYSEAELREISYADLTHPDDRAAGRAAWDAMMRGELSLYSSEKRYLRKDGRSIWINLIASLQSAESGRYILSILADITSRKNAEADLLAKSEQLRQSEETSRKQALVLQSIIAGMADAVIVADEQGSIVLFNPAARTLFGDPPDETVELEDCPRMFGLYRADGTTPLSADEFPLGCALRGDNIDSAEIHVRNAAVTEGAFLSVSAGPMTDEAGVIRGAVMVCRDITEARVTSEALRQAQKMEAVGQLTGGIAHDFNNLLQVIMGNSEILVDVLKTTKPQQKLAQMTLTAAQRGAELTSQLLSFSRRQALQPRPTDVRRLVAETESLLSGAMGASIEFKQDFPSDLWHVVVDPGMLQNAVVNLVLNARDSMPHGGRISIEAENLTCDQAHARLQKDLRPGDYVRISIIDSGIGIPPANLEKVFEPFFTTKEVGKGSGLGLSMVYGFVQQSGGAIYIRSSEGHGTEVQLYLPRAAAVPAAESAAPAKTIPHGSETILVVEDDPLVRDFVVAALRSLGYAVLGTTDGHTALQCLKAYEGMVHLLFSDVVMPGGMTGWDLAKHAVTLRPSLKVLLTSGYTEAVTGRSHPEADHALLLKPYSKTDLALAIRKALDADEARMAS